MAILFITHDLGVIAKMADAVMVMYLGQVMERAPVRGLFHDPRHPYTQGAVPLDPPPWRRNRSNGWRSSRARFRIR